MRPSRREALPELNFLQQRLASFPVSDSDEVLLSTTLTADSVPDFQILLAGLRSRPFLFGRTPCHVVERDDDHAASWLAWYTKVQLRLFETEMDPTTKRLRISIRRSHDWSTLGVWFELSTLGHRGFSRYGIRIRKLADEWFACQEG